MPRITAAFIIIISILESSPLLSRELLVNDIEVKEQAFACRDEIVALFGTYLQSGVLTSVQLFDTFYIPVPKTDPPKYNTQYNQVVEKDLQSILDTYLNRNQHLNYVIAVDRYGYLPSQNSKFSSSHTESREEEYKKNLAGQLLNDKVGLAASKNKEPYLIQEFTDDDGKKKRDLAVPIRIGTHLWGAVRFGYNSRWDQE